MPSVLLITGCISPIKNQQWLQISEANIRLKQYIDSIKYYITHSVFDQIVFCDNSNYQCVEKDMLIDFAGQYDKKLEWLTFSGNSSIIRQWGKGAGEDEILQYAFSHSSLLKNTTSFAKVTGRLILKNINAIVLNCKNEKNYFLRDVYRSNKFGVDTRFYVANKDFFKKNMLFCYDQLAKQNMVSSALEENYFKLLKGRYECLPYYPKFTGVSAGNGRDYGQEPLLQIFFFNVLAMFNLFNRFFNLVYFTMMVRWKIKKELQRFKI